MDEYLASVSECPGHVHAEAWMRTAVEQLKCTLVVAGNVGVVWAAAPELFLRWQPHSLIHTGKRYSTCLVTWWRHIRAWAVLRQDLPCSRVFQAPDLTQTCWPLGHAHALSPLATPPYTPCVC